DADLHFWRGVVYYRLGHQRPAQAGLTQAVQAEPNNVIRRAWLGRVLLQPDNSHAAEPHLAFVRQADDSDGLAAYVIAGGYAILGEVAPACSWLSQALQAGGDLAAQAAQDPDFGR